MMAGYGQQRLSNPAATVLIGSVPLEKSLAYPPK